MLRNKLTKLSLTHQYVQFILSTPASGQVYQTQLISIRFEPESADLSAWLLKGLGKYLDEVLRSKCFCSFTVPCNYGFRINFNTIWCCEVTTETKADQRKVTGSTHRTSVLWRRLNKTTIAFLCTNVFVLGVLSNWKYFSVFTSDKGRCISMQKNFMPQFSVTFCYFWPNKAQLGESISSPRLTLSNCSYLAPRQLVGPTRS